MDTQNITPLTPQKDRQVSGWLSFFLFVVGLGAAITVVTSIADFSLDAYDIGEGDFFIYLVALIDIVYVLGIGGLALYTILAFLNKRSKAGFFRVCADPERPAAPQDQCARPQAGHRWSRRSRLRGTVRTRRRAAFFRIQRTSKLPPSRLYSSQKEG